MTFELLEEIRLYVGGTAHAAQLAAQNCRLNGYKEVALKNENEAALGMKILRELANEHGDTRHARQKAHDQGR